MKRDEKHTQLNAILSELTEPKEKLVSVLNKLNSIPNTRTKAKKLDAVISRIETLQNYVREEKEK